MVWFEFNLSEKVALMCLEAEKSFLRSFPTEKLSSLYNDFFFLSSSLHTNYNIKKQRKSWVWFEFNLSEKVALMCLEAWKNFLRKNSVH